MEEKHLPAIIDLLDGADSAVRYWGVMGLLFQGKSGYAYGKQKLHRALKDHSPYVAITAAEVFGKFGSEEEQSEALKVLSRYIDPVENGIYLSILALNAINLEDEKIKILFPKIQTIPDRLKGVHGRTSRYPGSLKRMILEQFNQNL